MKQTKKMLLLLLTLTVNLFILCGCSTFSSAPSNAQLKADVENELMNWHYFLTMTDYSIERSITNEKNYSADISVQAQSEYADFNISGKIHYQKYDQGWMLSNCEWSLEDYYVTDYPDGQQLLEACVEDMWIPEYMSNAFFEYVPDTIEVSDEDGEGYFSLVGQYTFSYYRVADISGYVNYSGTYDPNTNSFIKVHNDNFQHTSCQFTTNFEGTWNTSDPVWANAPKTSYYLTIRDQQSDKFYMKTTYDHDLEYLFTFSRIGTDNFADAFVSRNCLIFTNDGETDMCVLIKGYEGGFAVEYASIESNFVGDYTTFYFTD